MRETGRHIDTSKIYLPIRPLEIPSKRIQNFPISEIKSGKIEEESLEIDDSVVAFLDILGIRQKKNAKDIEMDLFDFSHSLKISAIKYTRLRYNVFSDCAFISADIQAAADLISAIRFAFPIWISNGILVRGGIARGTYRELRTSTLKIPTTNFIGSLFSGTAVTTAVTLEEQGSASLLFTDTSCGEFYEQQYKEPIFTIDDCHIISWSDDDLVLCTFLAISLMKLMRLVRSEIINKTINKLINNIRYVITASHEKVLSFSLILAIISREDEVTRDKILEILKLNLRYPDDFEEYDDLIKMWWENKELILLHTLSQMDSSIPDYIVSKKWGI